MSGNDDHYRQLSALAAAQRENARLLATAVAEASAAGLPWRQIGEALGVNASVAFRQHKAGSAISVLRPSNKGTDPDKAEALAEVAAARTAAAQAQDRLDQAVSFARALGCSRASVGGGAKEGRA